ncbi:hypothetical protein O6H91_01G101800 [Diphasiastrum complanatum]|uniref:Uncharacterized protein n=3 Tax=Diphasiastrum complanatum TaxID=34168 RepID=A0ACC2ETY4_DIPCM|nr:hypothetical protein O6H91_01G101800 [Diphasiastrum complanatum]
MKTTLYSSGWRLLAHLLSMTCVALSIHVTVAQVQHHSSTQLHMYQFLVNSQTDEPEINKRLPSRVLQAANSSGPLIKQDAKVLLSVKASFLRYNPTTRSFASWNESDLTPCSWKGVNCSSDGQRVMGIDLSDNSLSGLIPSTLANLSSLNSLSLALNKLNGSIPEQLGAISPLTSLNLSSNALSGAIPSTLGNLMNLQYLDLSSNSLSGGIPEALFLNCPQMKLLNLSDNLIGGGVPATIKYCRSLNHLLLENDDLTGEVPAEIGQLPKLQSLILANNHFIGNISSSLLENCGSLEIVDLSWNNFTGAVPVEICNCSEISSLILSQNHFQSIPEELGRLNKLQWLFLGKNDLGGEIPPQIGSCRSLTALDLKSNNFSGVIPAFISDLKHIQFLALSDNQLQGGFPLHLSAIPGLYYLDLSNNFLEGSIPAAIANMSSLVHLFVAANRFSGTIAPELGNLSLLQILDMSSNHFNGSIPPSLGNLQNLLWLLLAHNQLTGAIPSELGSCRSLIWLNIANNFLYGDLPPALSKIGAKANLTFSGNSQSLDMLPKQLGDCSIIARWLPSTDPPFTMVAENFNRNRCQSFLSYLLRGASSYPLCPGGLQTQSIGYIQLSANRLSGRIPSTLGEINHLGLLFLDDNHFTDAIPAELSSLLLISLNFSGNYLTGSIPDSLGNISCLQGLDLSHNNLSGSIPMSLQKLTWLNRFNISYNPQLSGTIPTGQQFSTFEPSSYIGDDNLCYVSVTGKIKNMTTGDIPLCNERPSGSGQRSPQNRSSNRRFTVSMELGIIPASVLGLLTVVTTGCYLRRKKIGADFNVVGKESRDITNARAHVSLFSIDLPKQLTYADLVIATNNFDESRIIGTGGFGVVYKAMLKDGSLVAIKKLIQEGPEADREFMAEMETLGHLHHTNLVPLMGCSIFGGEKLLVYQYMPNGSLEERLHQRPIGAQSLDWQQRLNVAIGTARGLEFLHHSCSTPIIHRDMKASNILLDENFEPRLTDFGLARVLRAGDTHVSTVVAGTLGYVPPEYSQTWRSTTKGDVYSFGVVLLELITGGRPMDWCYNDRNCGNLVEFVGMLVRKGAQQEIFDAAMEESGAANTKELQKFLGIALLCTQEKPSLRPGMREVLIALEEIKLESSPRKLLDAAEVSANDSDSVQR